LAGKWVLMVSPHGPVDYFVGTLDDRAMKFKAERRGVVDPGSFYAPNVLQEDKGRRLLWGWVNGFPAGRGWRHCLTLPRVLDVAGVRVPLTLPTGEKALKLHVFLDRSLLEVYAADGRVCVNRVIAQTGPEDLGLELFAAGGKARVSQLSVWPVGSIW